MTQTRETAVPGPMGPIVAVALALSYPVVAHVAVVSGRSSLIAASIGLLVTLFLYPALRSGNARAWLVLAGAGAGLVAAARSGHGVELLFLPPVLITAFVAWIFGRTLRPGRTPLIEQAIEAVHGSRAGLTAEIASYARKLTAAWTALLAALSTMNLVLAALAEPGGLLLSMGVEPRWTVPIEIWSLFANIGNYLIVGVMFIAEYAYRRRRFPQQAYRGFFDFLRKLGAVRTIFRPVVGVAASTSTVAPEDR